MRTCSFDPLASTLEMVPNLSSVSQLRGEQFQVLVSDHIVKMRKSLFYTEQIKVEKYKKFPGDELKHPYL